MEVMEVMGKSLPSKCHAKCHAESRRPLRTRNRLLRSNTQCIHRLLLGMTAKGRRHASGGPSPAWGWAAATGGWSWGRLTPLAYHF